MPDPDCANHRPVWLSRRCRRARNPLAAGLRVDNGWRPPPADPRHPNQRLPLLPSGPGGICHLSSRGTDGDHHGSHAGATGAQSNHRVRCRPTHRAGPPRVTSKTCVHKTGGDGGMAAPIQGAVGEKAADRPADVRARSRRAQSNHRVLTRPQHRAEPPRVTSKTCVHKTGGEGGIRTRDTGISRIHTFQACSLSHSDTSPRHTRAAGTARAAPSKLASPVSAQNRITSGAQDATGSTRCRQARSDRWCDGNSPTSDRDYARLALEIAAQGHRDAAIGASIAASDRDLRRWFTRKIEAAAARGVRMT